MNGAGPSDLLIATATSASPGIPHAHIAVVGSMMRSGRATTQPIAATSTKRSRAARPGQPASVRSSHADGLSPSPNAPAENSAANAIT